ncbi:MAG: hypothetical protein ACFB5Z_06965 [Elainellaceae cyanobacterium]
MSDKIDGDIRQTTTYLVQERRLPGAKPEQTYTLVISLGKIQTEDEDTQADEDDQVRLQCPATSLAEAKQKYEEFCLYHTEHCRSQQRKRCIPGRH